MPYFCRSVRGVADLEDFSYEVREDGCLFWMSCTSLL